MLTWVVSFAAVISRSKVCRLGLDEGVLTLGRTYFLLGMRLNVRMVRGQAKGFVPWCPV